MTTLLLPNSAFSAEAKPSEQYGAVSVKDDGVLKKLFTVPGVKEKYTSCQEKNKDALDKIPNCIWTDLDPKQKEQVKQLYAQEESAKDKTSAPTDSKSSEVDVTTGKSALKSNLTGRKVNVGIDYKSDPAVEALSAFFGKKLDEVLNGDPKDAKDKKIIKVDHTKFIDLYASELGKSIINSFTSYCMETSPDCRPEDKKAPPPTCLISADDDQRKKDIEANLKLLKSATFSEEEGNVWKKCITDVSDVCYGKNISGDEKDKEYSKQKACLIMDFVKASRKNLIAVDEQKKFYDGLKGGVGIASNFVDGDKNASADKLTQITSADIGKDFKNSDNKTENIAKATEKIQKEADDCAGDGKISDQAKCKKFLDTNTEKNSEAVTEFGLRQFAQGEDLEKKLADDKNVETYLKEEGYTDVQIKDLTSKDNIEDVKQKIKERFNDEKAAIIKEMANRISTKTATTDGKIDDKDTSKMTQIKKELSSRNSDLKNLIHFNNIVSSYLSIEDTGTKKVSRNTASLFSEVESYDGENANELKNNLKNNKDIKKDEVNSLLKVEDINSNFLNYQEKKKEPTEK
ncbi:MAG: hypothetical protein ACXVCE_05945 [Bacteriovorax sp.]